MERTTVNGFALFVSAFYCVGRIADEDWRKIVIGRTGALFAAAEKTNEDSRHWIDRIAGEKDDVR
jgi:hypothetical protein